MSGSIILNPNDAPLKAEVRTVGKRKVVFTPPYFVTYLAPQGFLDLQPACHALFYYNQIANNALNRVKFGVELEGETTLQPNFSQLINSVARMYGIRPEQMIGYWPAVDMQCRLLGIDSLPDEKRYRFNGVI